MIAVADTMWVKEVEYVFEKPVMDVGEVIIITFLEEKGTVPRMHIFRISAHHDPLERGRYNYEGTYMTGSAALIGMTCNHFLDIDMYASAPEPGEAVNLAVEKQWVIVREVSASK
jgi:hypothetical protein